MIQKRFISYSLIIHLLAMSLLFIAPVAKEQKGKPFFARLVTAEDIGLEGGDTTHKSPKVILPPVPSGKSASLPRSSKKPSIPSAPSTSSKSPLVESRLQQGAKSQEAPAHTTAPSGSMSNGSEDLKSSQSGIPPGTGLQFPGKREDIEMNKGKGFSLSQSAREAGQNIAKKTEDQKAKSSISFDIKGFRYDGYMMRLKDKIEGIWQYPSDAAMRGIYGDLYLTFAIKKNGSLSKVELVRTSGYRSLDEAAMKALKDAAPYWPLPEDWKEEELTVKGHFIYSIYGVYVR
ncbi:MAG: TonB family protein [Thermodesulfovibrionales bacterium]|nr:TonB family protein [Thermodesulfovibrionales bacterium]